MKIYTQYDPPPEPATPDWGPSLTRQEFADECDINQILEKYQTQGIVPETNKIQPVYVDLTDPAYMDYQQAMNTVIEADYAFNRLPAKVRERFNNNPADLIMFVQDPANIQEAHKLGLLRDDYKSPSTPPEPKPAEPAKP